MFTFKYPLALLFLLLLPGLLLVLLKKRSDPTFAFPSRELIEGLRPTLRTRFSKSPAVLRGAAILFLVLAFARPQSVLEGTKTISEGVDIVLALGFGLAYRGFRHRHTLPPPNAPEASLPTRWNSAARIGRFRGMCPLL